MLSIVACTVTRTDSNDSDSNIVQNGNEYSVGDTEADEDSNATSDNGINFVTALIIIIIVVIVVGFSFFFFKNVFPVNLWFKSWTAGVHVGIRSFLNMYFQKIPPEMIVENLIISRKAGVNIKVRQLEDYYLANIDIEKIVAAQIKAKNALVEVSIDELAQAYLGKIDIDNITQALVLAKSADIQTNITQLSQLYHSGVDLVKVVKAKITAKNSNFPVEFDDLAEHYLAGGHIDKTVEAYVAAKKADLKDFDFGDIADLDLAGYKVFDIIEKAIIPSVHEGDRVRGVARDGVELSMRLKITLRAKLKHIIGNPEEKTILSRINESLATEIGLSETHFKVLENPFELADRVEQKTLDANTAFEILSIDVSDITIGKDVHAELRTERAKADAHKAKADLIKSEEKLKKAIAAAFIDGKISVNEYENLMNTQADTRMRNSISNFDLLGDLDEGHGIEEDNEDNHDED